MTYNITPIIQAVIGLCVALVTAFVIPWVKAKVGAQNMTELLAWVDIAVAAAEQIYTSTQGAEKKKYVIHFLQQKGYVADPAVLDNTVEAAVLTLHNELYGTEKVSA